MPARRVNIAQVVLLLGVDLAEYLFQQYFREADDRVERRPELVRHVGKKLGLVLVGDLELAALVLDFTEQPHVLERNRRLVAEGSKQANLAIAEWPHLLPPDQNRTERLSFPVERRDQDRAVTEACRQFVAEWIFGGFGKHVVHVDSFAIDNGTAGGRFAVDRKRLDMAYLIGRQALRHYLPQLVAFSQVNGRR